MNTHTHPIRILIVDDQPVVRLGIRSLLQAQPGFAVVGEASTGPEAIAEARRLSPEVVVMDGDTFENFVCEERTVEPPLRAPTVTRREREVIRLLCDGKGNKQVASELGISVKTVEAHRLNIMRKLRLTSLSQLVRYAIREGIVEA